MHMDTHANRILAGRPSRYGSRCGSGGRKAVYRSDRDQEGPTADEVAAAANRACWEEREVRIVAEQERVLTEEPRRDVMAKAKITGQPIELTVEGWTGLLLKGNGWFLVKSAPAELLAAGLKLASEAKPRGYFFWMERFCGRAFMVGTTDPAIVGANCYRRPEAVQLTPGAAREHPRRTPDDFDGQAWRRTLAEALDLITAQEAATNHERAAA